MAPPFGGAGGTVRLHSSHGSVAVNSTIEVSSDNSTRPAAERERRHIRNHERRGERERDQHREHRALLLSS